MTNSSHELELTRSSSSCLFLKFATWKPSNNDCVVNIAIFDKIIYKTYTLESIVANSGRIRLDRFIASIGLFVFLER